MEQSFSKRKFNDIPILLKLSKNLCRCCKTVARNLYKMFVIRNYIRFILVYFFICKSHLKLVSIGSLNLLNPKLSNYCSFMFGRKYQRYFANKLPFLKRSQSFHLIHWLQASFFFFLLTFIGCFRPGLMLLLLKWLKFDPTYRPEKHIKSLVGC